jgi:hypothetical protein
MRELRSFLWRRSGQIFPVLFHGSPSLPPEVQHLQHVDFTDFSLVGEGFKQTLAYAEFQKRVRDLAASIAVAIRDAPPFDPTAPISEMEQSEKV